jgi:hypothetical protein
MNHITQEEINWEEGMEGILRLQMHLQFIKKMLDKIPPGTIDQEVLTECKRLINHKCLN